MIEKVLANGTTVDAFPVNPAQQLMYFLSLKYGASAPVLNIGSGYYWQGGMDREKMREAVYEAIARCDTMRLRFATDEDYTLLQYVVDKTEIEIGDEDFSSISYEEATKIMKEWTKTVIDMEQKPVHTIKFIKLADGYEGLYFKFHHLAMDGYSSKAFIADLMAIYLNKTIGTAYPKPLKSYTEALVKEFAYRDSKQHELDQQYWAGTLMNSSEPIYTDFLLENRLFKQREEEGNPNIRAALVHSGDPLADNMIFDIDAYSSEKIMSSCRENGFSLPCVLMMGVRTALSVFNRNEKDVSFKIMVNRRATLLEKKSGGVRMHFFPMRTVVEPDMTFEQAIRAVENVQSEIFAHSNISTLEMLGIRHKVMTAKYKYDAASTDETYDSLMFSYHPIANIPFADEKMKKSSIGIWYNNDFQMQNFYITAKHRSNDDGLQFIFEYRVNAKPEEDLKIFYDKIIETIKLGLDNPQIKVSEILGKLAL